MTPRVIATRTVTRSKALVRAFSPTDSSRSLVRPKRATKRLYPVGMTAPCFVSSDAGRLYPGAEEHRFDRLVALLIRGLAYHGRRTLEAVERLAQRLRAERSLPVGQMLRLVPVRVLDRREVDVE